MRHINIPIFIPHLGCPNQCVFCNQRYISGTEEFDINVVDSIINDVLSSVYGDVDCEIAFFGGSFTGIDRNLMVMLLNKAQKYVDSGRVSAIRLSTRPDYINKEIIDILKEYTISVVELGIQSFNDDVLIACKRGHKSSDTYEAIRQLNDARIDFVGQMMIGLPKSTVEDEIYCAKEICRLGAKGTRIYPTIVFANTELEQMEISGIYNSLSVEEAIDRSAQVLEVFVENNVKCLRIGLCDSENLHSTETYVSGPNDPSIGELIKGKMFLKFVLNKIEEQNLKEFENISLTIYCPNGLKSQVIGHRRKNLAEILNKYPFKRISVVEDSKLDKFEIKIKIEGGKP